MKTFILFFLLFAAAITCFAQNNYNETLTITTYYPSPYGVYKNLRLHPTSRPTIGVDRGVMYYNDSENVIKYRNDTTWVDLGGGSGNGYWSENSTNNAVYLTDTGRNLSIGSALPEAKFQARETALGTTAGDTKILGSFRLFTNNDDRIRLYASRRTTGGADWTSADLFVQRRVGGTDMGYLKFGAAQSVRLGTAAQGDLLTVTNTGFVGINTTAPNKELVVNGNVSVSDNVFADAFFYSSDRALKKNIRPLENALEKVEKLNGVSFEWQKDNRRNIGLIAQEVEKVFPEAVYTDKSSGQKSIEYSDLIAALIESIKTQQDQIRQLKAEIETLKKLR